MTILLSERVFQPKSWALLVAAFAIVICTPITGCGTYIVKTVVSPATPVLGFAAISNHTFTVSPATPVLGFAAISNHTFGDTPFPVSASSASTGAISYAVVSGPTTISGNMVTLTAPGTVTLRASQAADANFAAQTAIATFTVSPATPVVVATNQSLVRINQTTLLTATRSGQTVTDGQWVVLGGTSNGSIDNDGTFHAPSSVPDPNVVFAGFNANGPLSLTPITIGNPVPSISSTSPGVLTQPHTAITITGNGFLPISTVQLNSINIQSSYIDPTHISAYVDLRSPTGATVQLTVNNPDPGASMSSPLAVPAQLSSITVSPQQLAGGPVSLSISGSGFHPGLIVFLDGKPLVTVINSSSSLTANGFLAPWRTGSVNVELSAADGTTVIAEQSVPILPTAVTFDAAARFTTQAAFGPRPDIVLHIQQIGFDAFITEQISQPGVDYSQSLWVPFLEAATTGNSLLRQRVAWALQNFIVPQDQDAWQSDIPIEQTFERDATGNFRTLMSDIVSDPNIASFLNLVNNPQPNDPQVHPNQNFARELMQLFTLGPQRLNDDGTVMTDSHGVPIPTYDQNTVIDLTRALTGWQYPTIVNLASTVWGIDFSQPLFGNDYLHDHTSKLLFNAVVLPSGQSISQDRDMALDAIFNHPNMPPFISRLLIQHLVKSDPSPDFTQRISHVFEDDGTGTRGNLAAVVRAVLLDPEARSGDTQASATDGFLQEPMLFQTFLISMLQVPEGDGQPIYIPGRLGEAWWQAPTVFGFYSPSYQIPGTSINSPEFALLNNVSIEHRSEILWGIVNGTQPGYNGYVQTSWLFQNFATVPDMVEALNHLAYHGTMSATEQQIIISYCAQLNPFLTTQQLQAAIFLALNGDSYTVSK